VHTPTAHSMEGIPTDSPAHGHYATHHAGREGNSGEQGLVTPRRLEWRGQQPAEYELRAPVTGKGPLPGLPPTPQQPARSMGGGARGLMNKCQNGACRRSRRGHWTSAATTTT
jgi:hypothetical protein